MSLLNDLKTKQEDSIIGRKPPTVDEIEQRILQPSILLNNLRSFFDGEKIPTKTRKSWLKNRTRLMDAKWTLGNIIGNCDAEIWLNVCKAVRDFHIKTINNSQPNGEWKIAEYEADIARDDKGQEIIQLAVLWIDALNNIDMQYVNGIPAPQVNINNSIPEELIRAMNDMAKSDRGTGDVELKELLKGLIAVMAKNQQPDFKPEPVVKGDD